MSRRQTHVLGEVVRLKSGGQAMTVVSKPRALDGFIRCAAWSGHRYGVDWLPPEALEPVPIQGEADDG